MSRTGSYWIAVNATGEVFLSGTMLNGRFVLRVAIGNIGTTEADVEAVWRLVKAAGRASS